MAKETPIIMSGNHPNLILLGDKTMTRRTWGLEEINKNPDQWLYLGRFVDGYGDRFRFRRHGIDEEVIIKCPYGGLGDGLWVKETWARDPYHLDEILYKADNNPVVLENLKRNFMKWQSPRFMFKKDARILLEITSLRAERLLDITLADAIREGFSSIEEFLDYWDRLNSKRGYGREANPWNWVIGWGQ